MIEKFIKSLNISDISNLNNEERFWYIKEI